MTIRALFAALALSCTSVWAAEPALLLDHFQQRTPLTAPVTLTLEEARAVQQQFVELLQPTLGPVVGYKAGLTNKAVQERLGVDRPLRGTLLAGMLLADGAHLPAAFGAVPMAEGDLVVRVGNAAINNATTPEEALAALDAVIPFLELPDMVYAQGVKLDAAAIAAINVGARYGVLGESVALQATPDWLERLRTFKLAVQDASGQMLAEGDGSALLGDPLAVVLWLRDSLQADGVTLVPGDLLSLGSVTRLLPVTAGLHLTATYTGLDSHGPISLHVQFD